ncbi:late histone H1-like [Watersipora subatra]|uniref:late histone H1-like n=1 Tax=Watersipora subatra TaxID=2589382 RepID=UPI00355C72B2
MALNAKPYQAMVVEALQALGDKKGSSRQRILKYILLHYEVPKDEKKVAKYMKIALNKAIESETVIQKKGKGMTGSFALNLKSQAATTNMAKGDFKKVPAKAKTTTIRRLSMHTKVISAIPPTPKKRLASNKALTAELNKTYDVEESSEVSSSSPPLTSPTRTSALIEVQKSAPKANKRGRQPMLSDEIPKAAKDGKTSKKGKSSNGSSKTSVAQKKPTTATKKSAASAKKLTPGGRKSGLANKKLAATSKATKANKKSGAAGKKITNKSAKLL